MDAMTGLRRAAALDRLAELEVQDAQLMAARARALVDAYESCQAQPARELAVQCLPMEIAAVCTVAQSTAVRRLDQARRLIGKLPHTWQGLVRGELVVGQALVLLEETIELDPTVTAQVDALAQEVLVGLTSGDTRRLVKRLILKLDADASEARRRRKHNERRLWLSARPDGRAFLGAEQSAEAAGSFLAALTELTARTFPATDPRTIDQQRADLFSQLPHFALDQLPGGRYRSLADLLDLDPTAPAAASDQRRRAEVQAVVLVPVETGLDLADNPGELVGYGPITAGHCRELLAAAELRKACTDRMTGRIIAVEDALIRPAATPQRADTWVQDVLRAMVHRPTPVEDRDQPGHDPSTSLARFVRLRDTRCSGPGCAQPAHRCDLDHLIPHPRGRTTATNLGPVSRRCHNAKTHGGWTLTPHPDGSVTWTSPLGHRTTRPRRTDPPDLTDLRTHEPPRRPAPDPPRADRDDPAPF